MPKFFAISFCSLYFCISCAAYKIDVQQGHIVTQAMINQLEVGMSARKVKFIMGAPLLSDIFHQQQWDYFYRLQVSDGVCKQRHITLFFDEADRLTAIQGDVKVGQQGNDSKETPVLDEQFDAPLL